jgi:hypothetical protein
MNLGSLGTSAIACSDRSDDGEFPERELDTPRSL